MLPLSILDLTFVPEGGRVAKVRMKKAKLRRRVTGAESVSISSNKLFRQLGNVFVFVFLI
jgi:hypothetical protein